MAIIAKNKKAYFEYFINQTLEAGIVLSGDEVKSLREGKVSINEAFAETKNGELWLINADIAPYNNSSKILVNRHEPYLERLVMSLVLEDKVSQAINLIKTNSKKKNSEFFEAYILLVLDCFYKAP